LGYSELSSFTHAFKRWTKMTSRQFRFSPHGGARRRLGAAILGDPIAEGGDLDETRDLTPG
jgi:hypothetical protein